MPEFAEHRAFLECLVARVLRECDAFDATLRALDGEDLAGPIFLVAAGKASVRMAGAAVSSFRSRIIAGVVVATPELIPPNGIGGLPVLPADHPLPTGRNVEAAGAVRGVALAASAAGPGATLLVLLSGGASAHLTLPAPPLELWDLRAATDALLRAGAPIQDLNCVRKHAEVLKGGRLAALAAPARTVSLMVSDVIGDHVEVIASGPTAPDGTRYGDALDVLRFHRVMDASPGLARFLEAGERGEYDETPKPGDPSLARVTNTVIAGNRDARAAAGLLCGERGFAVTIVDAPLEGEAKDIGEVLGHSSAAFAKPPAALIFGGETTVTVGSSQGKGGRNQELALAAAIAMDGRPNLATAAFGTDGVDGPTDAAGAIVTGETCRQARGLGMDPRAALAAHDSYAFFDALDRAGFRHLIRTGPTGTNVNDLVILLRY